MHHHLASLPMRGGVLFYGQNRKRARASATLYLGVCVCVCVQLAAHHLMDVCLHCNRLAMLHRPHHLLLLHHLSSWFGSLPPAVCLRTASTCPQPVQGLRAARRSIAPPSPRGSAAPAHRAASGIGSVESPLRPGQSTLQLLKGRAQGASWLLKSQLGTAMCSTAAAQVAQAAVGHA